MQTTNLLELNQMKNRKAIIVIGLVEESAKITIEEIEKEIFEELLKACPTIPWLKNVEKVTVIEN